MKLNYEKKVAFEKELKKGKSIKEIAETLGVAKTTLYYELKQGGFTRETYSARKSQIERGM
jgi:IS30 family transposase